MLLKIYQTKATGCFLQLLDDTRPDPYYTMTRTTRDLAKISTYRVSVADRPSLARPRLPIRQHGRVETVQAALDEGESGAAVDVFLGGVHSEHVVKSKAPTIPGNHLRKIREVHHVKARQIVVGGYDEKQMSAKSTHNPTTRRCETDVHAHTIHTYTTWHR